MSVRAGTVPEHCQNTEYLLMMQYNAMSDEFFVVLEQNLEKIEQFFMEKISLVCRKHQEIQQVWQHIKGNLAQSRKEAKTMRNAIAEFYLMVKARKSTTT